MQCCPQWPAAGVAVSLLMVAWLAGILAEDVPKPVLDKPKPLTQEQQEKLKERDRLTAEVQKFRKEEKLAEAIAACEKRLAIEQEVFGDLHDDVIASLNQLTGLHDEREDWPAAKKHWEVVLRIQTKRYGEQDWRSGDARRALADGERLAGMTINDRRDLKGAKQLNHDMKRLFDKGKYREAADLCRKALPIWKNVQGPGHPETATNLNNLAVLLMVQGDYDSARQYFEEALDIRKRVLGLVHPETAQCLQNLGDLLRAQGDYARARPYSEQAMTISKSAWGPEHSYTAQSLNNLGHLLLAQGDYAPARNYFEQTLAIRKKVLGPNHPDTATSLNNLGYLLSAQGDYAPARYYLEQSLAVRRNVLGVEHSDTAQSLTSLGDLLVAQGDYAGARPYLERAFDIHKKVLGREHPHTATSLNNLGALLWAQQEYVDAKSYHEQALAIRKEILGAEHPHTATSLKNLGDLLRAQGDYAGAQPYLEQALAIIKKALPPEHPDTAASLSSLGALLQERGDYASARRCHEDALAMRNKLLGSEHVESGESLNDLGYVLQAQGNHAGARRYYESALVNIQGKLNLAGEALSERQQMAMARAFRYRLDCYLSVATADSVAASEVYALVLQAKGAVLARQQRLRLARQQPELASIWQQVQSVSSRLATLSFATPDPKNRDVWRRQLDDATREKEELEVKLTRESAAFRRQKELQKLTPEQLQKALPTGTALVDFLEYHNHTSPAEGKGKMNVEQHLVAFVVRPDQPIVRVELGPAAPVATAIQEWRDPRGQIKTNSDNHTSSRLRRLIWKPLEAHVKDARIVLISPDAVLCHFPFAALPGEEPST